MISREEKHSNSKRLCYCCDNLQESEKDLIKYRLSGRGYGSIFDMSRFEIQLCKKCDKPELQEWFDETPELVEGYCEEFKFEESIDDFVNSFPIENQEYVWNGMDSYVMERQDWIDMMYGTLPDEKYEEYGMYSPRQIKAYEERFTTCEHPVNVVYKDDSKGCWCVFGANGRYNQETDGNISSECFGCENYKPRENPIKTMTHKEYKEYKSYYIGKINYSKYKQQFEEN